MPMQLIKLAAANGIDVQIWDFVLPLEAVYWHHPGIPPIIGLGKHLYNNRARFRTILAEELGHHFTTVGNNIPKRYYHYADRLIVSRSEYHALKWAATHLIPWECLCKAVNHGIKERWELANYFDVTEELIEFRLKLPDIDPIKIYRSDLC